MIKVKKHFLLKTMYNIIMFRKTIFEILTRNRETRKREDARAHTILLTLI